MPIKHIAPMTPPLALEAEGTRLYMTHIIFDGKDNDLVLIANYDQEDILVFVGRTDETSVTPVEDEVQAIVAKYIEENPITLLDKEQIEAVALHG